MMQKQSVLIKKINKFGSLLEKVNHTDWNPCTGDTFDKSNTFIYMHFIVIFLGFEPKGSFRSLIDQLIHFEVQFSILIQC